MSAPSLPPARAASPEEADCRCLCGSLLARWVDDAVELKCRRCKRRIRVPIPPAGAPRALEGVPVIPVGETG